MKVHIEGNIDEYYPQSVDDYVDQYEGPDFDDIIAEINIENLINYITKGDIDNLQLMLKFFDINPNVITNYYLDLTEDEVESACNRLQSITKYLDAEDEYCCKLYATNTEINICDNVFGPDKYDSIDYYIYRRLAIYIASSINEYIYDNPDSVEEVKELLAFDIKDI